MMKPLSKKSRRKFNEDSRKKQKQLLRKQAEQVANGIVKKVHSVAHVSMNCTFHDFEEVKIPYSLDSKKENYFY